MGRIDHDYGLLDGNQRFVQGMFRQRRQVFRSLLGGQRPRALYIGCADSRVVPEFFLDTGPGELFILRNVGAMVPPPEDPASVTIGAALDYAIDTLGVPAVVVCGHDYCGALQAIVHGATSAGTHLDPWLNYGRRTLSEMGLLNADGVPPMTRLVEHFVARQLAALAKYPAVARAIDADRVVVRGWIYNPEDGRVRVLGRDGAFHELVDPTSGQVVSNGDSVGEATTRLDSISR